MLKSSVISLVLLIAFVNVYSNEVTPSEQESEKKLVLSDKICKRICHNADLIDEKYVDILMSECGCQAETKSNYTLVLSYPKKKKI